MGKDQNYSSYARSCRKQKELFQLVSGRMLRMKMEMYTNICVGEGERETKGLSTFVFELFHFGRKATDILFLASDLRNGGEIVSHDVSVVLSTAMTWSFSRLNHSQK